MRGRGSAVLPALRTSRPLAATEGAEGEPRLCALASGVLPGGLTKTTQTSEKRLLDLDDLSVVLEAERRLHDRLGLLPLPLVADGGSSTQVKFGEDDLAELFAPLI